MRLHQKGNLSAIAAKGPGLCSGSGASTLFLYPAHPTDGLSRVLMRLQRCQLGGARKTALALNHPSRQALAWQCPINKYNKTLVAVAADALRAVLGDWPQH